MTVYNVKNRGAGVVTYIIPDAGIRRSFAPGETKKISEEELTQLTFQPGGTQILAEFLQIQDPEIREELGIRTEPEYDMSEADVIELLKNGSLNQFLDALDFAPRAVIDLIKTLSVSLPLSDYNKRKALKEKTGFDVDAAVSNNEADKADDATETAAPTRRAQPIVNSATAPARRTTPKYTTAKTEAKTE